MKSVWKMLAATLTLWLAMLALVMGTLTTGLVVALLLFFAGLLALFGGAWLTVYLLRRDAHFNLHLPLIWLIPVGAVIVVIVVNMLDR